jgi:hypothetical protein
LENWLLGLGATLVALQLPLGCIVGRVLARRSVSAEPLRCPSCGGMLADEPLCETCGFCEDCCDCNDGGDFDRDELGDDPEED